MFKRGYEQLHGRLSGPMQFRLWIQPIMAALLAIRAGVRDAREGKPAFLWALITISAERRERWRSAWKDIRRVFFFAIAIDAIYQIIELRAFYIVQAIIVAFVLAIVPYVMLRGIVRRVTRLIDKAKRKP
jgi:hypothetical protein